MLKIFDKLFNRKKEIEELKKEIEMLRSDLGSSNSITDFRITELYKRLNMDEDEE